MPLPLTHRCICCFNFCNIVEVLEYVDGGKTPLCPYCGIDALVSAGISYTELKRLHTQQFSVRMKETLVVVNLN